MRGAPAEIIPRARMHRLNPLRRPPTRSGSPFQQTHDPQLGPVLLPTSRQADTWSALCDQRLRAAFVIYCRSFETGTPARFVTTNSPSVANRIPHTTVVFAAGAAHAFAMCRRESRTLG